mmetsp:Transcript_39907/g.45423  ORF Transcript_39907/g.45423 Transcript_39907/m.45423 type:complete len:265 (+) Transcript_39907:217-1011(+)
MIINMILIIIITITMDQIIMMMVILNKKFKLSFRRIKMKEDQVVVTMMIIKNIKVMNDLMHSNKNLKLYFIKMITMDNNKKVNNRIIIRMNNKVMMNSNKNLKIFSIKIIMMNNNTNVLMINNLIMIILMMINNTKVMIRINKLMINNPIWTNFKLSLITIIINKVMITLVNKVPINNMIRNKKILLRHTFHRMQLMMITFHRLQWLMIMFPRMQLMTMNNLITFHRMQLVPQRAAVKKELYTPLTTQFNPPSKLVPVPRVSVS